eukprot:SAG11_NODE_703_length_7658_cov_12.066411_8_plen_112_part_00
MEVWWQEVASPSISSPQIAVEVNSMSMDIANPIAEEPGDPQNTFETESGGVKSPDISGLNSLKNVANTVGNEHAHDDLPVGRATNKSCMIHPDQRFYWDFFMMVCPESYRP